MDLPKITMLIVGSNESPIMTSLLKLNNVEILTVCSNILDYELPALVKNTPPQWHRDELREVLRVIAPENYTIAPSLKNLLEENDRLQLDELGLAITTHISQIEQNSQSLEIAYDLLSKETGVKNFSVHPLVDEFSGLLVFKNKKYAPLRYYLEQEELLKDTPPVKEGSAKRKIEEKSLNIENLDKLKTLKLLDSTYKEIQDSDLIIIMPTDIISFGVLLRASEIEKQIKKLKTPIVLLWPFDADQEASKVETEVAETMNFGSSLDLLAEDIAKLTDYIILDKSDRDYIDNLREAGCHVLFEDLFNYTDEVAQNLISTISSIGKIEVYGNGHGVDLEIPENKESDNKESEEENVKDEIGEDEASVGKSIAQLIESPEEAGLEITKDKKESAINDANQKSQEHTAEELPLDEEEGNLQEKMNGTTVQSEPEITLNFEKEPEEEWIDTVNRGIEVSFKDENDDALQWLITQSNLDNDNEIQIAHGVISRWLDSRSNTSRKTGAKIVALLAKERRDTYLQILQQKMMNSIIEGQEDVRRKLIPIFEILNDVDATLSEQLTRGLTRELIVLKESEKAVIVEKSKLTILQLVIRNKKLTRVAIHELLVLLDKNVDSKTNTTIWNLLTSFEAGTVALELVTQFSTEKVNEILTRANILRFTGSVIETFNSVLEAWKNGDKAAISSLTGTILPDVTLRKFERLELARKVQKLKMVQLSALAESIEKDQEGVERLITELIMKDELKAEMKLIDDKMYIVAESDNGEDDN